MLRGYYEIEGQAVKGLNVELELALTAIKKCLILLHDDLGPDTK